MTSQHAHFLSGRAGIPYPLLSQRLSSFLRGSASALFAPTPRLFPTGGRSKPQTACEDGSRAHLVSAQTGHPTPFSPVEKRDGCTSHESGLFSLMNEGLFLGLSEPACLTRGRLSARLPSITEPGGLSRWNLWTRPLWFANWFVLFRHFMVLTQPR